MSAPTARSSRGQSVSDLARNLIVALCIPLFAIAAILPARRRRLSVFGATPLISNRYWSLALREAGVETMTIMEGNYAIFARDSFDRYFEDFAPRFFPRRLRMAVGLPLAMLFTLRRARVVHMHFDGFALGRSSFWRLESVLFRWAGIATVVTPYGADAYVYSRIVDTSLRFGLMASYPQLARRERQIVRRIDHWCRRADCVMTGCMIDGIGRSDVTSNQIVMIDCNEWEAKSDYSMADGSNGVVRIVHTPNHRGFKGTEFLVRAVEELQAEGLQIELVMLEKVPNAEVRRIMGQVDILAEQFIAPAYALSGIEGMARGLPVLANLDHEAYTRVFRRYGFLDECPILSSPPERLRENIRALVTSPALREELGRAGRAFVEKYHSYDTARYMFGAIYDRILEGQEVDLINLFHPLKSAYNRSTPLIDHPLVENRLPSGWHDGAA